MGGRRAKKRGRSKTKTNEKDGEAEGNTQDCHRTRRRQRTEIEETMCRIGNRNADNALVFANAITTLSNNAGLSDFVGQNREVSFCVFLYHFRVSLSFIEFHFSSEFHMKGFLLYETRVS
jgi:hypothetical protein